MSQAARHPQLGVASAIKRKPLREAPEPLKALFEELRAHGDHLVYEDENHQPVLSIAPLREAVYERRMEAAKHLNTLLDSLPPSPLPEEEVNALIEEAIQATKGQYPGNSLEANAPA